MASVSQLNPYQCDQCGTANIVAAPVLYQQGTHTYSTRFHSGTTQSFSAQAVTASLAGFRPAVSCLGTRNCFILFWGFVGFVRFSIIQRLYKLRQSCRRIFWFWVSRLLGRHGLQFSQNCALQP